MKINKISFIVFVILLCFPLVTAVMNEGAEKDGQTQFLISTEQIEVQKDETIIEQQRLSKEGQYLITKAIKEEYINEMWATYSSTMTMLIDLIIMMFLTAFITLFIFIMFELIPMGLNRIIDLIEGWMR